MTAPSSPTYRAIIVDDEPLAREGLRDAIGRVCGASIEVVASCENGIVALDAIQSLAPDILFLDIVMPVLDGFAMLERLEPEAIPVAVVVVTAHDEYAVRAFDVEAVDFLVKPSSEARLRSCVERAMRRVAEARALGAALDTHVQSPPTPSATAYIEQLVISEPGRTILLPVDEIDWIEGDTYYVRVHSRGRTRLLRERMSRLETMLNPARFRRTHRSAIVRVELIREVRAESAYTYSALLSTGERVPVSRERLKALQGALTRRTRPP